MIICKKCGTHNQDEDAFCGICGAFLEWEGQRVDTAGPPVVPPASPTGHEPRETPAPAPATQRPASTAAGAPASGEPAAPTTPAASGPPAAPATASAAPATPATTAGGGTPAPPASLHAPSAEAGGGAPGLQTPEAAPAPASPAAVLPQAPRPVRHVTEAIGDAAGTPAPIPGGVNCPSCGLDNQPDRQFCRRCGTLLHDRPAAVPEPPRRPWVRRWFSPAASAAPGRPGPGAGTGAPTTGAPTTGAPSTGAPRPGQPAHLGSAKAAHLPSKPLAASKRHVKPPRGAGLPAGRRSIAGKSIIGAVVVVVVVGLAVPGIRNKVRNAVDPSYHAVALAQPSASATATCSNPALAAGAVPHLSSDNTTLYWVTGPAGTAPQAVTVRFATATSIDRVRISTDVTSAPAPASGAAPHPLEVEFTPANAAPATLALSDPPKGVEAFHLNIANPTTVRISILSADPGASSGSCAETAFNFDHKN